MSGLSNDRSPSAQDQKPVSRRHFLESSSALAVSAALGSTAASAQGAAQKGDMKYRRFGATGLMVSEIGLGCASGLKSQTLGPFLFNRYREQLPAIVDRLFERGGNFVATSQGYHDTEEILGRALKGRRKNAIIFTATGKSTPKEVIAACARHPSKPAWQQIDQVPQRIARLLADGQPVAWFQGRMEFGPRALGGRSILGCPSVPGITRRPDCATRRRSISEGSPSHTSG